MFIGSPNSEFFDFDQFCNDNKSFIMNLYDQANNPILNKNINDEDEIHHSKCLLVTLHIFADKNEIEMPFMFDESEFDEEKISEFYSNLCMQIMLWKMTDDGILQENDNFEYSLTEDGAKILEKRINEKA